MRFEFDQEADALAIVLLDGLVARTEQIDLGTLVDLDQHGQVLAIEVIRPARHWPLDDVVDRYELPQAVAEMLRALWPADHRYPFADPADVGAEATRSAELAPA